MRCSRCGGLMASEWDALIDVTVCRMCGNRIYGLTRAEKMYEESEAKWGVFKTSDHGRRKGLMRQLKAGKRTVVMKWKIAAHFKREERTRRFIMDEVMTKFADAWRAMSEAVHKTAVEKGWWDRQVVAGKCIENGKQHKYLKVVDVDDRHLKCKDCGECVGGCDAFDILWDAATERNKSEILALIHSELSEALEGLRKGDPPNDQLPQFKYSEVELADVLIRLADAAAAYGWRVGEALAEKTEFNKGRSYRHGGKAF